MLYACTAFTGLPVPGGQQHFPARCPFDPGAHVLPELSSLEPVLTKYGSNEAAGKVRYIMWNFRQPPHWSTLQRGVGVSKYHCRIVFSRAAAHQLPEYVNVLWLDLRPRPAGKVTELSMLR